MLNLSRIVTVVVRLFFSSFSISENGIASKTLINKSNHRRCSVNFANFTGKHWSLFLIIVVVLKT